jgi:hypothetical protein
MQVEERKDILAKLIQNHQSGHVSLYVSNISKRILIDILVEYGDKDILIFYIDGFTGFYIEYIIQYCMQYSKKDILDYVISEYCPDDNIEQWMCRYAYQYNNKEYINMSNSTQISALRGACVGNHPSLVKEVLEAQTFIIQNTLMMCAKLTKSLEIIQLLYPSGYISSEVFIRALRDEAYNVVDWIIDNNLELYNNYTHSRTSDYSCYVNHLKIKPILYLILNKKIKITPRYMRSKVDHLELLVLIHFSDFEYRKKHVMLEEYLEQFLSMYPNCNKTKFKSILCNDIRGDKYIDQYLINRDMIHNEMRLLYDLPDDLCKQIL